MPARPRLHALGAWLHACTALVASPGAWLHARLQGTHALPACPGCMARMLACQPWRAWHALATCLGCTAQTNCVVLRAVLQAGGSASAAGDRSSCSSCRLRMGASRPFAMWHSRLAGSMGARVVHGWHVGVAHGCQPVLCHVAQQAGWQHGYWGGGTSVRLIMLAHFRHLHCRLTARTFSG